MKQCPRVVSRSQRLPGALVYAFCLAGLLWSATWTMASRPQAQMGEVQDTERLSRGRAVAEIFVTQSPTFRFDGLAGSVQLESARPLESCAGCYEYTLYFESRHPGYGDRKGQGIAPALTPHRARILLVEDRIVTGILDQAWDIAAQRIVDFE